MAKTRSTYSPSTPLPPRHDFRHPLERPGRRCTRWAVNREFVVNPTFSEMEVSALDLRLAGTRDAILMVECGAREVPEETMAAALDFGHKAIQPIIDAQLKMQAEVGKAKREAQFFTETPGT
jgi:polyribonucleotide nucleotidyltransferase